MADYSLTTSWAVCAGLAQQGSNFSLSFWMLPRRQRRAMHALYAFMRLVDDVADLAGDIVAKRTRLQTWREGLRAALRGEFTHPIFPALADTIHRFHVDPVWLHQLLDGVESDLLPRRFADAAELARYCDQVAGMVGLCCLRVWECRYADAEPLALAAGQAFQLTNILRDVREDARQGRVYVPQADLAKHGVTEAQLLDGSGGAAYERLMTEIADRAERCYVQSEHLENYLPTAASRAMWQLMHDTYRALLERLRRQHFRAGEKPLRLPTWKHGTLLLDTLPVLLGMTWPVARASEP
jgi:phytoene synthase